MRLQASVTKTAEDDYHLWYQWHHLFCSIHCRMSAASWRSDLVFGKGAEPAPDYDNKWRKLRMGLMEMEMFTSQWGGERGWQDRSKNAPYSRTYSLRISVIVVDSHVTSKRIFRTAFPLIFLKPEKRNTRVTPLRVVLTWIHVKCYEECKLNSK